MLTNLPSLVRQASVRDVVQRAPATARAGACLVVVWVAGPLLAVVLAAGPPRAAPGQTTNARQQQALVSVVAQDGSPVAGLTAADFTVREDGIAREVLRVAPATDPIDVALLVDNSQAMSSAMADLRDALKAFVQALNPKDAVALVTVADRPTVLSNYTLDRASTLKAVERLFAQDGSGTDLLDAIVETTKGLGRRSGPAAIVVVTGEGQEFSNLSYQPVLDAIKASGASFAAEVLTNTGDRTMDDPGKNRGMVLDAGPRTSGGRSRMLVSSLGLRAEFTSLAAELNSRYLVTYGRPESLIPPEKIEVGVKRPELTVRATRVKTRPGA